MEISALMQHFGVGPRFVAALSLGDDVVTKVNLAESVEHLPEIFGAQWKQLNYTLTTNHRGRRLIERINRALGGKLPRSGRALDIGCGYGGTLVGFHEHGLKPIGIDMNPKLTSISASNLADRECDADIQTIDAFQHLEGGERYDLIVLNDVIEHLADPARAIALASAALNSGGVLAIYAPNGKHPAYATRDPHNGVFGAAALPRSLAMPLVNAVLKHGNYSLGEYPSLAWLSAQFEGRGLSVVVDPTDYGETLSELPKYLAEFYGTWSTTPHLGLVTDPILRREIVVQLLDYGRELSEGAKSALLSGHESEFVVRFLRRAWLVLGTKS